MEDALIDEVDAFRFLIGTPTETWSTFWKIWERNGQVYALSSAYAGTIKLSIHTPDVCQFGFEKMVREKFKYGPSVGGIPTFIRWKRTQTEVGQMVPIAFLYFPTDYLKAQTLHPSQKPTKPHTRLKPAPKGNCVEILLAAIPKPQNMDDLDARGPFTLLCWMPLGQNEVCAVLARHSRFSFEDLGVGNQIELIDELYQNNLGRLSVGESISDQTVHRWNEPLDFQPIKIIEMTGMTLTKGTTREVLR